MITDRQEMAESQGARASALPLSPSKTVRSVADSARDALLVFVSQARRWNKQQLARWLVDDYAKVTVPPVPPTAPSRHRRATLQTPDTQSLVARAHTRIVDIINEWDAERIALQAERAGIVRRVRDARGDVAYAPVDAPNLPLLTRLLSLWIVESLGGRPIHEPRLRPRAGAPLAPWNER